MPHLLAHKAEAVGVGRSIRRVEAVLTETSVERAPRVHDVVAAAMQRYDGRKLIRRDELKQDARRNAIEAVFVGRQINWEVLLDVHEVFGSAAELITHSNFCGLREPLVLFAIIVCWGVRHGHDDNLYLVQQLVDARPLQLLAVPVQTAEVLDEVYGDIWPNRFISVHAAEHQHLLLRLLLALVRQRQNVGFARRVDIVRVLRIDAVNAMLDAELVLSVAQADQIGKVIGHSL